MLYGRGRLIKLCLVILIVLEIAVMAAIGTRTVVTDPTYLHISGILLPGCQRSSILYAYRFYALPAFIVAFIMFVMTIYRCGRTMWGNEIRLPVITLLLRDGVFWFLAILIILVPQITILSAGRKSFSQLLVLPSISAYSVVGSRVLLNVKSLLAATEVIGTNAGRTITLPTRNTAMNWQAAQPGLWSGDTIPDEMEMSR
ncbi:hypothetical protein BD779DRAFT_1074084 [Infundibulicybe gibba]|nr:hypothetical protein BD779DRAFT_1074084 [Infundibulicybe gibba]